MDKADSTAILNPTILDPALLDVESSKSPSWLPSLIRGVGAFALAIAMYTFLMKGWQQGSDLLRYGMMLAHTITLLAAGLLSGRWLHESKGARLLVIMALASIPANAAILGGFLFSTVQPELAHSVPRYVAWSMDSLPLALGVTALSMAVLLPVARLGFAVLVRSVSARLALLFMAGNALLLLPLRDTHSISAMALLFGAAILFTQQRLQQHITSRTQEGIIASSLLFLPLVVLLGRSAWLYANSFFITFACSLSLYGMLRRLSLQLPPQHLWREVFNRFALLPAFGTALLGQLHFHDGLDYGITLALSMLTSAAMLYDLSLRTDRDKAFCRSSAALMFAAYFAVNLLQLHNAFAAQLCLLSGVALLYMGQRQQQRSLFVTGVIMVIAGLGWNVMQIFRQFNLGSWFTLALLGVGLILFASWLETRGDRIKPWLQHWRTRYADWEI